MPEIDTDVILPAILMFVLVAGAVWLIVKHIIDYRKRQQEIFKEWEKPLELPPIRTVGARVISKRSDIAYNGSVKHPDHQLVFYMSFYTDDMQIVEHQVDKAIFETYKEYDTGTLVVQGEEFLDFGEGEPIG